MANKETLEELSDREIKTLEIFLTTKAKKTAITIEEYITTRLLQGASRESIRQVLLDDLKTGGRIFGEFRNGIKATANGTIHRFRDNAEFSELGLDLKYRWAAVLVKTCPDCLERHGKVKTWEEWEEEGLPRTGQTVCKEWCRCMLIPARMSVLEPIQRTGRN